MKKKVLFMQRVGLETIISEWFKTEGLTREKAIVELNILIKEAEPDAELIILDEFSARTLEFKKVV